VEKIKDGEPGTLRVTATMQKDGSEIVGEYNTVSLCLQSMYSGNTLFVIT